MTAAVAPTRAAADDIADALVARSGPVHGDITLARGSAGLAVALAHLGRRGRPSCEVAAAACLELAVSDLERARTGPSLFAGFTGVAWAVAHVQRLSGSGPGDVLDAVDAALLEWLERPLAGRPFDLTLGLAGVGVYALERLPDDSARRLLDAVVSELAERAVRRHDRLLWLTPPESLPHSARGSFPRGRLDLGMAHGAAGVVAFLAAAAEAGESRARDMLSAAVRGLLAHDGGHDAGFPEWAPVLAGAPRARVAWCYGDLGVAAALVAAGEAAGAEEWRGAGVRVALRAAARAPETSGVVDAGLCHGSAGIAHLFAWLAASSGDRTLAAAADAWLARTLALRADGGVAGYLTWDARDGDQPAWRADPGLLNGAAGVALALDAADDVTGATWNHLFLPRAPAARATRAAIA